MVIVCNGPYPVNDALFIVDAYMRPGLRIMLSDFQKWAIKAIVEGDNVLITAHTGSGKTLPAEFAINYFVKNKKKVIYASPIKALSNQKLYDMRKKFPHISFGILTGDCKDNPEADVLIMTTEILLNKWSRVRNFIRQNSFLLIGILLFLEKCRLIISSIKRFFYSIVKGIKHSPCSAISLRNHSTLHTPTLTYELFVNVHAAPAESLDNTKLCPAVELNPLGNVFIQLEPSLTFHNPAVAVPVFVLTSIY